MARRRSRHRETVSIPPREVRDRRRASRVDRLGELRECGFPIRSGRQPRLVGDRGGLGAGAHSPKRLRSGLQSATARFDSGARSRDQAVATAPVPRPMVRSRLVRATCGADCPRSGHVTRPRGNPRLFRLREGATFDRCVLPGRNVAGDVESVSGSRVRRSPSRGLRADPSRRQLGLGRGRFGDERRRPRTDQSSCRERESPPRGPTAQAARTHRTSPQQRRRGGRPRGPRVEHELGARFGDGESRGGLDRGRPGSGEDVRDFVRRGLGGAAHVRPRRMAARGPARARGAVRARRRRVRRLPSEIESKEQRHKAPRAGANACLPRSSSPRPTSRSSATAR